MLHRFSRVQLFVTPWTVARQTLQTRILEWIVIAFSWGFSQPRYRTQVSCTAGGFFTAEPPGKAHIPYRWAHIIWPFASGFFH